MNGQGEAAPKEQSIRATKGDRSMSRRFVLLTTAFALFLLSARGAYAGPNKQEAEIRDLLQRWEKAFRARDVDGVMAVYAPGTSLVAYDVIPPLEVSDAISYRK